MMLRNNFYEVKQEQFEENAVHAILDLNAAHEVFEGHFPEQPIVPGVFQIQVIKELLAKATNSKLQLDASKEIKFLRPISPEAFKNLEVIINIKDQSENAISFSAQMKNAEAVFLKYRGVYKVA